MEGILLGFLHDFNNLNTLYKSSFKRLSAGS